MFPEVHVICLSVLYQCSSRPSRSGQACHGRCSSAAQADLCGWCVAQDGRACTQGLEGLQQVRVLRLEHVRVTCLPPNLEELTLFRCRAAMPQPPQTIQLHRLTISSCSMQVCFLLCLYMH